MKPNLLENYKFESQVNFNEKISNRIQEPASSRVPDDGAVHSFAVDFHFPGQRITSLELQSPQLVETNSLSGFIRFFSGTTFVGRLMPWSYKKDSGRELMYPNDEVITNLGYQGFNVKKCGIWHWRDGNKFITRWRHFFRPSEEQYNYALQYEFDCVIHTSGMIEFIYPGFDSLLTGVSKTVVESTSAGSCIGIRTRNDGLTLGDNKIQVIDVTKQMGQIELSDPENDIYYDNFLGGYRVKGNNIDSKYPYLNHTGNYLDWPGKNNTGVVFRFIPPPAKIKKVLPRKLIKQIPLDEIVESDGGFDDRKSINFSVSQSLTSPTNLPHLYGQGTTFKINDFLSESDININRTVHPRDIKNFLKNDNGSQPFNDSGHPEVDLRDSQFYLTGTAVSIAGMGFEGSLNQKEKFTYEFPVDHQRILPGDRASLFLYDTSTRTFHGITSSVPDSTDPDKLWVNMFGDAKLFGAFGGQVFSTLMGVSSSPNRLFPESWEKLGSLKSALDFASRHDSESHISRYDGNEISLGGRESGGLDPIVYKNDFNAPFLLEKICLELPVEAGPGWFDGKTISLNYGNQVDPSYSKYDAGGPCVTVGLIKESSNKKVSSKNFKYISNVGKPTFTNREVIASCALIPSGDNTSGYFFGNFVTSRLNQGNDSSLNVQLIPSGFNFYSTVQKYVIDPNQDGYFTGSVKLNFAPQNSSIFYYSKSSSDGVVNPKSMYDFDSERTDIYTSGDNNILVKLENFKLPSQSGVSLSDNRNVLGSNKVFYDDRFEVKSPWNQFDKYELSEKFDSLINEIREPETGVEPIRRPTVFYLEKEPLNFSENYSNNNDIHVIGGLDGNPEILPLSSAQVSEPPALGFPIGSWEAAEENTDNSNRYFNVNVSNSGMIGIFNDNPYLLMPGDKISVFVSKFRPVLTKITSKLGGYVEFDDIPGNVAASHDIKISRGRLKLTLFGSYISNGREFKSTKKQFECHDKIVTYGDNPVVDQFEIEHNLELLGTHADNWVYPIEKTQFTTNSTSNPNLYGYEGVGEGRMRLYGSTYGKLQANYRDSSEGMKI